MPEKDKIKTALNVQKGISQPDVIDSNAANRFKKKKRTLKSVDEYVKGIIKGDISSLSQAITLVESSLISHRDIAQQIINNCLKYSGNSLRIGFTGVPGVGKSTFIETLGMILIKKNKKIAVLAIDPSSERSGGSILGDKTRMEQLSAQKKAFIRPSPSSGSLGGVARKTAETIILCEAAGFDTIFIETVGVGQSETAVRSMVDFFLLLMLAGAGDELQGIKRGIMEMADIIVITKADRGNIENTKVAQTEYKNALHLFPPTESGWIPQVLTASSITGQGIETVWNVIENYQEFTNKNNFFTENRNKQSKFRMIETINEELRNSFYNDELIKDTMTEIQKKVTSGEISPYFASKILLKRYFER